MDATQVARAASVCLLLGTIGCVPPNGGVSAQPGAAIDATNTPTALKSESSDAPDVQTAGDIDPAMDPVQRWIDRIDDMSARVNSRREAPGAADGEAGFNNNASSGADACTGQSLSTWDSPAGAHVLDATAADSSRTVGEPSHAVVGASATKQEIVEPPVLGDVAVRAATPALTPFQTGPSSPKAESDANSSEAESPGVNAPSTAANAAVSVDQLLAQWLSQPRQSTFRAQLDRSILMVLAGRYEEARGPLEMVSDEQRRMGRQFIEALISIRESHGGDPEAEVNRVLTEIDALSETLIPLGEPVISSIVLARAVSGFGRYEAFTPPHFIAERQNEFVVYCELRNFISRADSDGGYESEFGMTTTILSRGGDVVLELVDDHITDRCRSRRRDCFIPRLVRLPATLSPGEYVVKVSIVDKIGEKVAENKTEFRIVARS